MRRIAAILFVFSLACCPTCPLFAQEGSATLTGFVQDSSKAVILGVKVTAIATNTNQRFEATTAKDGSYTIVSLPVGPYQMQIEKPGFKTILKDDLFLHTQDALQINFQMAVGSTSETITVNGSATNDSPAVSMTVTRDFVENMPLDGRSFQDLLALAPGATNSGGYFSIDGQRNDSNNFTVDGISANLSANAAVNDRSAELSGVYPSQTAIGTTQALASVDALQEFRIQTSGYTAEYGRQPGGQVQITTRSGTNEFHGSAFDYLRNTDLDANDWFSNHEGDPRGVLHQNDFGGTFGGPLRLPGIYNGTNKSFFFFNYEGLRLLIPNVYTIPGVPTASFRQSAAAGVQPFLDAFPIPNGPPNSDGISAQWTGRFDEPDTLDSWSIRGDHQVRDNLRLFARFAYTPSDTVLREQPGNTLQNTIMDGTVLTLGSMWTITPHLVDDLRLNYSRSLGNLQDKQDSFDGATPIPLNLVLDQQAINSYRFFTSISISVPNTSFDGQSSPQLESFPLFQRQYNLVDSLSWTRGSHTFKAGVDYRHLSPTSSDGQVSTFMSIGTLADIQTGVADYFAPESRPDTHLNISNLSLYIQDHWKASQHFALDYGLRWELNPPPSYPAGTPVLALAAPASTIDSATFAPIGSPLYHTSYANFAPRFGFAWNAISGYHAMVLRGGVGLFYDTGQAVSTTGGANESLLTVYNFYSPAALPVASSELIPPNAPIPPTPPYPEAYVPEPNLKLPYTEQWNLSLDVALNSQNTLTASYVGNEGKKLLFNAEFTNFTTTNPELQNGFGDIVMNSASSTYSAFQLQDQGYIRSGLQVIASYTWAHSIDNLSNDYQETAVPERGNSNFDIRHALNAALNYSLPSANGNRLIAALSHGWLLGNRFTAETGGPLWVIQGYYYPTGPGGLQEAIKPDRVQGVPAYLHNVSSAPGGWELNAAAFSLVALNSNGTPISNGTLARNSIYGPAFWNLDTALQRTFHIHENLNLDLRVEAFNTFNHPNFGEIDTNLTDSTFGQSLSTASLGPGIPNSGVPLYNTGEPRSLQVSLKLKF